METDPRDYIDAEALANFPRGLLRHLEGWLIVICDGGSNYKGLVIRAAGPLSRLRLKRLQADAPVRKPVEMIRALLDRGLLANFVPADVSDLERVVLSYFESIVADPKMIRSQRAGSKPPFPDRRLAI